MTANAPAVFKLDELLMLITIQYKNDVKGIYRTFQWRNPLRSVRCSNVQEVPGF